MSNTVYYIICAILSVGVLMGISLMSKVKTAVVGNMISAVCVFLGVFVTLLYNDIFSSWSLYLFIISGIIIGSAMANRVKMIQMPQFVALLNGVGGFASALVGVLTLLGVGLASTKYPVFVNITSVLAIIVGVITLSGSLVAAGKLHKKLPQKPVIWKNHTAILNISILILLIAVVYSAFQSTESEQVSGTYILLLVSLTVSLLFGVAFSIRVGGADMPITISLLNSLSGVAGSIAGMAVGDLLLVSVGGIVGASGLFLTQIMCRSMNRSLADILTGKTSKREKISRVENTTNIKGTTTEIEKLTGINKSTSNLDKFTDLTESVSEIEKPAGINESTSDLDKPAGIKEYLSDIEKSAGIKESTSEIEKPTGINESTSDLDKPAGINESTSEIEKPTGIKESTSDIDKPSEIKETISDIDKIAEIKESTSGINKLTEIDKLAEIKESTSEIEKPNDIQEPISISERKSEPTESVVEEEISTNPKEILTAAKTVIIVPGYGMALAQAQHLVRELADKLESNGAMVKYAIHPVAGRMPGHMNVLLAEADVSYEKLYEMDSVNDEFAQTDVAIVIGANDVLNPSARDAVDTPIYGMPVLNVDRAKEIFICNYDLNPGYSGVDNPLYTRKKGVHLFLGDAKESLALLVGFLS